MRDVVLDDFNLSRKVFDAIKGDWAAPEGSSRYSTGLYYMSINTGYPGCAGKKAMGKPVTGPGRV